MKKWSERDGFTCQRAGEKKNKMKFLYLKRNWLTQLLRLVNPKPIGWNWQAEGLERTCVPVQEQGLLLVEPRLDLRSSVFCSFQAFSWLHEAHSHKRVICLTQKVSPLNVNLIERNLTKTSGIMSDCIYISGYHGLHKLALKLAIIT